MDQKIRVLVAKPGLDGHDRGAKIVARALRDAGMEVVYTGLHQTAEMIVDTFPVFLDQVNVRGIEGEFWSYRKIVRRTLWHQRDHIEHIKELAFQ